MLVGFFDFIDYLVYLRILAKDKLIPAIGTPSNFVAVCLLWDLQLTPKLRSSRSNTSLHISIGFNRLSIDMRHTGLKSPILQRLNQMR